MQTITKTVSNTKLAVATALALLAAAAAYAVAPSRKPIPSLQAPDLVITDFSWDENSNRGRGPITADMPFKLTFINQMVATTNPNSGNTGAGELKIVVRPHNELFKGVGYLESNQDCKLSRLSESDPLSPKVIKCKIPSFAKPFSISLRGLLRKSNITSPFPEKISAEIMPPTSVKEANRNNNITYFVGPPTAVLPNLTISGVERTPDNQLMGKPIAADTVSLTAEIENNGRGDAKESFVLAIYKAEDVEKKDGAFLTVLPKPLVEVGIKDGLKAGGKTSRAFNLKVADESGGVNFYQRYVAIVDNGGVVSESDENDNRYEFANTDIVSMSDLLIDRVEYENSDRALVYVKNIGNAPSSQMMFSSVPQYPGEGVGVQMLDKNKKKTGAYFYLQLRSVEPGQTQVADAINFDPSVTYYFDMKVDPKDYNKESNEDNNTYFSEVPQPAMPPNDALEPVKP